LDIKTIQADLEQLASNILDWLSSAEFYSQIGLIILAILLSYSLTALIKRRTSISTESSEDESLHAFRLRLKRSASLLFPLFNILFLTIAIDLSEYLVRQSWLVRVAGSVAVLIMIYQVITGYVNSAFLRNLLKWVVMPIALLQTFGWLDEVILYLDSLDAQVGNIRISAYGVVRVLIFGVILFWLGRVSNSAGQRIIRKQEHLDTGTRELFAKLYQVMLLVGISILLLQVMGINITALAVFGGALGVGLGFGLQSIASNFISGVILLLDRSLTEGDYIELADGHKGTIRELNMRSTTLETFDGKDIMVPNEQFITTNFINWTHKNKKQRYAIEIQVDYDTDLRSLFELLRTVVSSHPKVLSGPDLPIDEQADAEISGFGESGIDILIEFWMEGIDDGVNRVGADLFLMIWEALKENHVEIPYPQRVVRMTRVA